MKRSGIIEATLGVLLALGFVGVWQLQKKIDGQRQALQEERDELVLRSPKLIKRMSLEYAPLVGAMYWTRAVQYYGEKHRLHQKNLELLWPLLDITTTLDPNLIVAYRFGSTFLSDAPPRGAGDPDHAVELLRRGVKANPDYWRFYQDMGNVYYFDKKDYPRAAEAFAEGSQEPAGGYLDEGDGRKDCRRRRVAGDLLFPVARRLPDGQRAADQEECGVALAAGEGGFGLTRAEPARG